MEENQLQVLGNNTQTSKLIFNDNNLFKPEEVYKI